MQLWAVIEFGRIWESPIFYPMPGPVDQPQPGLSPPSTDFSPDAPWHSGASPDQIFEVSLICVIAITRALISHYLQL